METRAIEVTLSLKGSDGKVVRRAERYTSLDQAMGLMSELVATHKRAWEAFRDARLALGSALYQIRAQVPPGQWLTFLDRVAEITGIHRGSLRKAIACATRLCCQSGRLDQEKVAAAAERMGMADCLQRDNLTMTRCEEVAGLRGGVRTDRELMAEADRIVEEARSEMGIEPDGDDEVSGNGGDGSAMVMAGAEAHRSGVAPESIEAVGVGVGVGVARGRRPEVVGQMTLGQLFGDVEEAVKYARKVESGMDASRKSRLELVTRRYLAEVQEICGGS